MSICDDYFSGTGILFESEYEDAAVHMVRSDPDLEYFTKKEIIICWFDQTYGEFTGLTFHLRDSRARMSQWLTRNHYRTFEDYLEETNAENTIEPDNTDHERL